MVLIACASLFSLNLIADGLEVFADSGTWVVDNKCLAAGWSSALAPTFYIVSKQRNENAIATGFSSSCPCASAELPQIKRSHYHSDYALSTRSLLLLCVAISLQLLTA